MPRTRAVKLDRRTAYGTLTDNAYASIKRKLISLEIPPGTSFSETHIATSLGMSKTPVREALGQLKREGLVEVEPRSGYRAAPVTIKDTRDLFGLRLILEEEAASLAAGNIEDPTQLMRLEELCRAPHDGGGSIASFLVSNTEFHATVARIGGNARLAHTLEQILGQLERLFRLALSLSFCVDEMMTDHRELVEAIVSGNGDLARDVAAKQIRASQKMVLEALLASPKVLSMNVYSP